MGQDQNQGQADWVNQLKNNTIQDAKDKMTFAKQRQDGASYVDQLENKIKATGEKYYNKFADWLVPPPVYKDDDAIKDQAPKQSQIKISNMDATKPAPAAKQDAAGKKVMPKRVSAK